MKVETGKCRQFVQNENIIRQSQYRINMTQQDILDEVQYVCSDIFDDEDLELTIQGD